MTITNFVLPLLQLSIFNFSANWLANWLTDWLIKSFPVFPGNAARTHTNCNNFLYCVMCAVNNISKNFKYVPQANRLISKILQSTNGMYYVYFVCNTSVLPFKKFMYTYFVLLWWIVSHSSFYHMHSQINTLYWHNGKWKMHSHSYLHSHLHSRTIKISAISCVCTWIYDTTWKTRNRFGVGWKMNVHLKWFLSMRKRSSSGGYEVK